MFRMESKWAQWDQKPDTTKKGEYARYEKALVDVVKIKKIGEPRLWN